MNALLKAAASRVRTWRETPRTFFYDELKFDFDAWQEEFIEKLPSQDPKEKQIALKACTGPGKSAVLAGANLWFVAVFGGKTGTEHPQGVVTSIDQSNLKSGIWKEIAAWRSHSEYLQAAYELTSTRLFAREFPETWFVEARTWAKKADPEAQGRAMSGIHGPFLMATLDESGDMPAPILRVAQQIFSSQHRWAKVLTAGNPTSLEGALYHICVTEAHRTYVISITADPDDPKRAKRTDIENAREQIRVYGRTNPWVMATILGQFPPSSINALLGIEDVEAAMRRHARPDAYDWAEKRLGVDCARFGDDRTTICPRQGIAWFKPVELRGVRTSVIAARIITGANKWEPRDPTSIRVLIDQTGGWGQGTVDQLDVAGYAPMDLVYSTPSPDPKYYNLRSYMHFTMADHVRSSAVIPDLPETKTLRAELTAALYTLREGKLWVIDKAIIKQKLGYSPDLADGYAQTYAIPDMPKMSRLAQAQARRAKTEFDPHREEETRAKTEFDPYRETI
jgi:phage terminase large subunit